MSVPAKAWVRLYQDVTRELGMPARGPRGCAQNQKRQELGPKVFAETQRRWKLRRHRGH